MSIQNVVLGALIARRGYGYGYELRDELREICEALGYSENIVYASLKSLRDKGLVRLVEPEGAPSGDQASQRRYHEVTERGRERHREWKASMPSKAPLHEDIHMQLLEAEDDDLPQMVEALTVYEAQCREQLRRLIERPLRRTSPRRARITVTLVQASLVNILQAMIESAQRNRESLLNELASTGVPGRHRP